MRIKFKLTPPSGQAVVPRRYQHLLGSAVYRALDDRSLHDDRNTKLFCISPLFFADRTLEDSNIRFQGDGYFVFCSPSLAQVNRLLAASEITIAGQAFGLTLHSILDDPLFDERIAWRVPPGSGVLTRRNLPGDKTELTPLYQPKETANQLEHNLRHRWKTLCQLDPKTALRWSDADDPLAWLNDQQVSVAFIEPEKSRIVMGKVNESCLKAWIARFQVTAPEAIQRLIWSTGIGGKSALGFGYAEVME